MIVPRQLQQRLAACIAIMAVLLLFVAPVVSKSLMHHQMMGGMAQPAAAMPHDMHAMAMPAADHVGHHGMSPEEMIFCGYCELLIHVPLLLWVFVPLLWLMTRIARLPCAPRVVPPPIRRLSLRPCPRGPPGQPFLLIA
ncbi:DUF2946 domain-containing protein [Serratia marcescens]|uniref:DUF2946 domain-containing protein n=1 Tax=Serratia marcescens TaxID=615 RepID=UPI0020A2FFC6|nr:DUF2946 domain-containing protein [Serratia marcescens]